MIKKVYYIENSATLDAVLADLAMVIPCFIYRDFVEMNYSEINVVARVEDLATVENYLAALV